VPRIRRALVTHLARNDHSDSAERVVNSPFLPRIR
jgi:hypothetical protein